MTDRDFIEASGRLLALIDPLHQLEILDRLTELARLCIATEARRHP